MDKIDFVLPWVDGSDNAWQELKRNYIDSATDLSGNSEANADCRYKDNGLLRYWFRGVERFAPWVNRVFFVTCGQKPDWLDESNPKLRLVNHRDYIPAEYLPTFQSNTIELNLHRLADLSERFVLFNDDTFLLQPVTPEFFFRKGRPVIPCSLGIPSWLGSNNISRVIINNNGVLKRNMDVNHQVWRNIWKFIDVRELGFRLAAKNILSFAINGVVIPGSFGHQAQSHLKSTFDEIWRKAPRIMDEISRYKFRNDASVNQWLACAWNMVSGNFYPANEKRRGLFFYIRTDTVAQICDSIRLQPFPLFCMSDKGTGPEMDRCFQKVSGAFNELFPVKSSFEK